MRRAMIGAVALVLAILLVTATAQRASACTPPYCRYGTGVTSYQYYKPLGRGYESEVDIRGVCVVRVCVYRATMTITDQKSGQSSTRRFTSPWEPQIFREMGYRPSR